jgi:hypothetical protein
MSDTDAVVAKPAPSRRLRIWLIAVTILSALAFLAAIPSVLFGTYMAAFAADDPSASTDAVWNLMLTVWAVGVGFVLLLIVGVAGGWIAYRKRRNRLSFVLSLLAGVPVFVSVAAIVAVILLNVIWTASL